MDVVLIVIDTVRKDFLSPFGDRGFPAPALERLAEEATLYRNVISPAPWTTPVHASFLTGLYPSKHGTHGGRLEFFPSEERQTLMARLRERGYRCVGITANYLISDRLGFSGGFDRFIQVWQAVRQRHRDDHFQQDSFRGMSRAGKALDLAKDLFSPGRSRNAMKSLINRAYARRHFVIEDATFSTRRALEMGKDLFRKNDDAPLFLFINLMQAHDRYNPPDTVRRELGIGDARIGVDMWRYYTGESRVGPEEFPLLSSLYAGEIYFLDRCLGAFIDFLRNRPSWEETLVIIVSDHGEMLGEHGVLGHLTGLFRELIDVPMMVRYPSGLLQPGEDGRLRQSHDLFATVLELAGADLPIDTDAYSLLDTGGRREAISQLVSHHFVMHEVERLGGRLRDDLVPYARPMMAIVRDRWKYVSAEGGDEWLFDRVEDPGEAVDRSDDPAFRTEIESWRATMRDAMIRTRFPVIGDPKPLEEDVVERLRAMRYI
jgi:arylsulfatase A-like enzyme